MDMTLKTRLKLIQPIIIVALLSILIHTWAVSLLPQDFDEPIYLQNGFDYAAALKSGGLNAVIDYTGTQEHPAFVKLLYGGVVTLLGKAATWTNAFYASRALSALFGVLGVLFVAIALDPLAGGMFAIHTLAVKYSSQVYLEAVPQAFTIAAVLALLRVEKRKPDRWLWFSAISLGIAAASKYSYIPVILVVLASIAILEKKLPFGWLVAYGAVAVTTFFVLDVHLWRDPFHRLIESVTYHAQYSQGAHVQEVGYPWYQPFIWIFTASPYQWHPNVFFYFGFDGIFSALAVFGLRREWKERRWLVIWFIAGIIFLLLWPTKWPQYALTVTPAICIMAAETSRRVWRWFSKQNNYWDYLRNFLPPPSKWLWWAVGTFALFLAAIYLSAAIKLAVGKIGWSEINAENSPLPGDTINGLLPLNNGQMLVATDHGAAIVSPDATSWTIYQSNNSGLPDNDVLAIAQAEDGGLWFGTDTAISRFDGTTWTSYPSDGLGLLSSTITSIAAAPDGTVYAGTLAGAAMFDGAGWGPVRGLVDKPVFSLTFHGGSLWAGTDDGVHSLEVRTGTWTYHPTENAVKHILFDSTGTLWVATSGSGLARWDGSKWEYYTVASSGIPFNTVNWVEEVQPGNYWVGTALPNDAGGILASFDGEKWHTFDTSNSGASGSEPLVIAYQDTLVWIGTRSRGIETYKLGK
jgi:sugar lactone lactonase YvrE/4-amino-4-deoxy-L-arabinose transferase-like glycosyltransferase